MQNYNLVSHNPLDYQIHKYKKHMKENLPYIKVSSTPPHLISLLPKEILYSWALFKNRKNVFL